MKTEEHMGLKVHFRPGTSDEAVILHSFENDIFYFAIPDYKPKSPSVIIDIGAHIGTFSLLSAVKFDDVSVYAFEPNIDSYELLNQNVVSNNLNNVHPKNLAVTAKSGKVELHLDSENWGHSTTFQFGAEKQLVDSITLGDFIDKNTGHCDLIKFNCEGAEFEIIYSLSADQLSKIGMLLILYHEDLANAGKSKALYQLLKKNRFTSRIVNKHESRGWLIAKNRQFYERRFPRSISDLVLYLKEIRTSLLLG